MIVVVANEKKGVGKTTLSSNLAIMRAQCGHDVLYIDGDPQKSAAEFIKTRESEGIQPPVTCVSIEGVAVPSEILKLAEKFDSIVIDASGRDITDVKAVLLVADVVVAPFLPDQLDCLGIENMDHLVYDAQLQNPNLRALAVLNKSDTSPMGDFPDIINLHNLQVMNTCICDKVVYKKAMAEGKAIFELEQPDPEALKEIEQFYQGVFTDEIIIEKTN